MHSIFRKRRNVLVGLAHGKQNFFFVVDGKFAIKINAGINVLHKIYADFPTRRPPPAILLFAFKYRAKLIPDYPWIFHQVEKSSTSALHRTPDPSTLPSSPSEPKLINVTSSSITLAWNKVQLKQGSSSFIGYTVEYFSSDSQKGWVLAVQRVPSNVVTVSWIFNWTEWKVRRIMKQWFSRVGIHWINVGGVQIDVHNLMDFTCWSLGTFSLKMFIRHSKNEIQEVREALGLFSKLRDFQERN